MVMEEWGFLGNGGRMRCFLYEEKLKGELGGFSHGEKLLFGFWVVVRGGNRSSK